MLSILSALVLAAAAPAKGPPLDVLVEASTRAITDPAGPFHGRELERFSTAGGEVRAFETDIALGGYPTRYIFLVKPADASLGPMSFTFASDPFAEKMSGMQVGSGPMTLDQYSCRAHTTREMLKREASYDEVRARVVASLETPGGMTATQVSGRNPCPFIDYVLPGLTRKR